MKASERWEKFHTDKDGYPKQTVPRKVVRGATSVARIPGNVVKAAKIKMKKEK